MIKFLITLAYFFALSMLFGCGGAAQKAPPLQVSFYTDSILSGSIKTGAGWLSPRPVERTQQLSNGQLITVDLSIPGATVQDVAAGVPGVPFGKFSKAIEADPSRVLVLAYSTAGALRFGGQLADYEALLGTMTRQALALGKTVVLVGSPWIASPIPSLSAADSDAALRNIAAFDLATRSIAAQHNLLFINLRSLRQAQAADMADDIHPGQAYSELIAQLVAQALLKIHNHEVNK